MPEKATVKKDQQKNKKPKPIRKKKNQENGTKFLDEPVLHLQNIFKQKKKGKIEKNEENVKTVAKNLSKKRSESFLKRFFLQLLIRSFYVFFFLGLLYIVDVEKFSQLKNGAEALVNKTVSFLPEGVVTQGKEIIEYTRPAAEFTINKMRFALNETSNFLNTSPIFKEHWMNVKEISSISSAHMVDYIRTLYLQITGICQGAKNKLF